VNARLLVLAAAAALTLGMVADNSTPASATAGGHSCRIAAGPNEQAWTVVRVSVDAHGHAVSKHIVWESGDTRFDRSALAAVEGTTFASDRAYDPTAATFDYLVASNCNDKRSSRIMPVSHAPRGFTQPPFHITPRENAWTRDTVTMLPADTNSR
jgi:hypothetical protein